MHDKVSASWLFVAASRPDRFEKAAGAGADETILDLEDAVGPHAKPEARTHAADWLSGRGSSWVRINGFGTPWHNGDIDALAGCGELRGLVIPKAEDPQVIDQIATRVQKPIVALIETARGVRALDAICACPGVARLAFGSIDLALDIDAQESDDALLHARSAMVIASRAAELPSPIDGVTVDFRKPEVVSAAAARSRALGFGGKLCIHPAQVQAVNTVFGPTPAELDWAQRVLAAASESDGSAFTMDGRMVDKPLLERAQRLVARAGEG